MGGLYTEEPYEEKLHVRNCGGDGSHRL